MNEERLQISEQDILEAASAIGCEVAVVRAVAEVEGSGSGYFKTGECKVLFEPHVFWQQLELRKINPVDVLHKDRSYADILYKRWKTYPYKKAAENWESIRRAMNINLDAAYESASFGMFQIMGYHYAACGYRSVVEFVHYMDRGEKYHLKAFVNFIIHKGLAKYLRAKDWAGFAKRYNGAGYKNDPDTILDDYDYKLKKAYEKFVAMK